MPDFTLETTKFIAELDAAVEAHMDWTRRVLRCAVLRESPGEDAISPSAHTLCRFGRWFGLNKPQFEQLDAQNTHRLEVVHQSMHDAARSLCADILTGAPGQRELLESFELAQRDMIGLLARYKTGFLATAARVDPLTGLPLRYGIETEFKLMQQISKRSHFSLYLVMIDIDHFKNINDTYGHPVGDVALRHLAEVLKRIKRDNEPLYRFGGEEFLMLMQSASPDGVTLAAQRLLDAVRNTPVPISQDQSVRMTITLGLTCVGHDEDMSKAIERADKALYEGKRAGRDRYVSAD